MYTARALRVAWAKSQKEEAAVMDRGERSGMFGGGAIDIRLDAVSRAACGGAGSRAGCIVAQRGWLGHAVGGDDDGRG